MQPLSHAVPGQASGTLSFLPCAKTVNPRECIQADTAQSVADYFPRDCREIMHLAEKAIAEAQRQIAEILAIPCECRNFMNTVYAADLSQTVFHSRIQTLAVVAMTNPDKQVRETAKKEKDQLNNFYIEQFQSNAELSKVCIALSEKDLSPQQRQYLEDKARHYRREGLHLDSRVLREIIELKKEMSELEARFIHNLDEDKSCIWVTEDELQGISEDLKRDLRKENGLFQLTCNSTCLAIKSTCQIQATRKAYFKLYQERCHEQNLELLKQLVAKRDLLARKLGYSSFAAYDIEDQMAQTPEKVGQFLEALLQPALNKFLHELKTLPLKDQKIEHWDIEFQYVQMKKNSYQVDEKRIKEYFPFPAVLINIFNVFERLFQLKFRLPSGIPMWHEQNQIVAVYDEKEQLLGHMILDLIQRDGKFGHGYCVDVLSPYVNSGHRLPGIAVVILNLSTKQIWHQDVETIFHECGHALHQLLGCAEMPSRCGYHTKSDFLELPSILLEELAWDADVLKEISCHYETKEPLPKELITAKIATRYYNLGFMTLYQWTLGMMSLEFFKEGHAKNIEDICKNLYRQAYAFIQPTDDLHQETFLRHLADPLYRSKYYSYHWADVFAKDIYNHLRGDPNSWIEYRRKILEQGGGINPNELLSAFLGRTPEVDAFIKLLTTERR